MLGNDYAKQSLCENHTSRGDIWTLGFCQGLGGAAQRDIWIRPTLDEATARIHIMMRARFIRFYVNVCRWLDGKLNIKNISVKRKHFLQ